MVWTFQTDESWRNHFATTEEGKVNKIIKGFLHITEVIDGLKRFWSKKKLKTFITEGSRNLGDKQEYF